MSPQPFKITNLLAAHVALSVLCVQELHSQGGVGPYVDGPPTIVPGLHSSRISGDSVRQIHMQTLPGDPPSTPLCAMTVTNLPSSAGGAGGQDLVTGYYDTVTDQFFPDYNAIYLTRRSRNQTGAAKEGRKAGRGDERHPRLFPAFLPSLEELLPDLRRISPEGTKQSRSRVRPHVSPADAETDDGCKRDLKTKLYLTGPNSGPGVWVLGVDRHRPAGRNVVVDDPTVANADWLEGGLGGTSVRVTAQGVGCTKVRVPFEHSDGTPDIFVIEVEVCP